MLQALHELHSNGIMHGDVKPWNFLVLPATAAATKGGRTELGMAQQPSVRIADFGSCSLLHGEVQVKACTYPFAPWEAFT